MPRDAHTTAAYHHERAAKSDRAAAEQSNQGAHQACEEHALTACGHSTKADEASTDGSKPLDDSLAFSAPTVVKSFSFELSRLTPVLPI